MRYQIFLSISNKIIHFRPHRRQRTLRRKKKSPVLSITQSRSDGVFRYMPSDLEMVIELFRENVPAFFHDSEETQLRLYLETFPDTYFLLKDDGLVACGGFTIEPGSGVARISWDFVKPSLHGKGYGSILLNYRIARIREISATDRIEVYTSQLAFGYYQKHGFQVTSSEKDYWAKGYDLVSMEKQHED
jgi:[ribosomal protein S18]-alanine N-acetyltransferase